MKSWFVYIMSNKPNGTLYIGVTDNIEERVKEHKLKVFPNSFTSKYNCDKLIYLEEYKNDKEAIKIEKQMKKWKRGWKIELIEKQNPSWMDISINWSFNYKKLRNER